MVRMKIKNNRKWSPCSWPIGAQHSRSHFHLPERPFSEKIGQVRKMSTFIKFQIFSCDKLRSKQSWFNRGTILFFYLKANLYQKILMRLDLLWNISIKPDHQFLTMLLVNWRTAGNKCWETYRVKKQMRCCFQLWQLYTRRIFFCKRQTPCIRLRIATPSTLIPRHCFDPLISVSSF